MAPIPGESSTGNTDPEFRDTNSPILPREPKMAEFLTSVTNMIISYIRVPKENRENIDPMLLFSAMNKEIENAKKLIDDDNNWHAMLCGLEKKEKCDDPAEALKTCHCILWQLDHAEPEFMEDILDQNEVYKRWRMTSERGLG